MIFEPQLLKDFSLIGFLLIAIIILLKVLYEVRKQTRTIKDLQFQLKAHDLKETQETKHG